jgi:dihydrofolate synthase/folylpolyglutamate synthase
MADPPGALLEVAAALGADLRLPGRDFRAEANGDGTWRYLDASGGIEALPAPALEGVAQVGNAATALAALRALASRLPLARESITQGLREVRLPGRFQRVAGADGIEWILDVAHNPAAAAVLADSLSQSPVAGRTLAVCGMLSDKDIPGVLAVLRDQVDLWFAATTEGPRGLSDAELVARASSSGIRMTPAGTVPEAMRLAAGVARAGDRILVFGSFHTVGPALSCV